MKPFLKVGLLKPFGKILSILAGGYRRLVQPLYTASYIAVELANTGGQHHNLESFF